MLPKYLNLETISYDSVPAIYSIQAAPGPGFVQASSFANYILFDRPQWTAKTGIGALGSLEVNMFWNMDYSGPCHRFFDKQKPAYWLTLGEYGLCLQYAPPTPVAGDVWDAGGQQVAFNLDMDAFTIAKHLLPAKTNTSDLGCSSKGFRKLYIESTNSVVIGNVTMNKAAGRVNVEQGQQSITVSNTLCKQGDIVQAMVCLDDPTVWVTNVVPSTGSLKINLNKVVDVNTAVNFFIVST